MQISALRGAKVESLDGVFLHPFDFAVVTCDVLVPRHIIFETDFLACIFSIDFKVVSGGFDLPVQVKVVDEDIIWKHYESISRDAMFLKPPQELWAKNN
jgi:hypothetical protein